MPRICTICSHPERRGIDAALVHQTPYRTIAHQWCVSKDALIRHKEHLPVALTKAQEASEAADANDLLSQVRSLQTAALGILAKAEKAGDLRTALSAIAQARGNLELLAKLLGELSDAPTVNVLVAPEWIKVRTTLLDALALYPKARATVAERLLVLEG